MVLKLMPKIYLQDILIPGVKPLTKSMFNKKKWIF